MAESDTDNRATWALEIDGSGAAEGAGEALDATERLRAEIDKNVEALGEMGKALRVLKKADAADSVKRLKDQMTVLKATMKSNVELFEKGGGSLAALGKRKLPGEENAPTENLEKAKSLAAKKAKEAADKKAKESAENMKGLASAINTVGGPLARVTSQGKAMASVFGDAGKMGVAGSLVITAAAAALVTAAVVGLIGVLGHFALSAANAQRAELLMLEGMTQIPNWLGVAAGKATELQAAITAVSANVALGRDRVVGLAQDLYKAHLRGENLKQALEATAMATAAAGESYGAVVKNWLAGAGMVGGNVGKLAQQFKNRFGAVARAQMLDLNVQFLKMRENVRQLFSGLRIEGFLEALSKILGLFSDTTAVGRALKGTLELLVQPLLDGFARLQPIAKRFFQGMTIASIDFQIAVLTLRNRLRDAFGSTSLFKGIDWLTLALKAGQAVVWGFIGVTFAAAAAVAAMVVPFVETAAVVFSFFRDLKSIDWSKPVLDQFGQLKNLGERIGEWVGKAAKMIVNVFRNIDWGTVGSDIWEGLKRGLAAGFSGVFNFVKGLAKGLIKGFASELKIGSPSKVFESFGHFTAVGYAQGMDAGVPQVQASMSEMIAPPTVGPLLSGGVIAPPVLSIPSPAVQAAAVPSGSSGTNTFQFGDINVHGVSGDAKTIAKDIVDEIVLMLEGARIHMGSLGAST